MSEYIYGSLIDAMAHCIGLDCIDEKRTFFKATKNILWTATGNEKLDWLYEVQSKEHHIIVEGFIYGPVAKTGSCDKWEEK